VISEGQRGFSVTPVSLGELKDLTSMRQRIEAMALTDAIANGDADWEAAIMAAYHRLAREPLPTDSRDTEATLGWSSSTAHFTTRWWPPAARPGCCACAPSWPITPSAISVPACSIAGPARRPCHHAGARPMSMVR
jgi:hypothetical protein